MHRLYIFCVYLCNRRFAQGFPGRAGSFCKAGGAGGFYRSKKGLDDFILTLVLTILSSALVTVIFKNIPGSRFGAGDWVEILILNLFPLALTHIVSALASVRILAATSTNNSYDPMGGVLASLDLPQVQELLEGTLSASMEGYMS